jgi:hypothetical protein
LAQCAHGLIVTGVIAPGVGPVLARLEPKPVMRAVLAGGLADPAALREDYLDELLKVGHRPGCPAARIPPPDPPSSRRGCASPSAVPAPPPSPTHPIAHSNCSPCACNPTAAGSEDVISFGQLTPRSPHKRAVRSSDRDADEIDDPCEHRLLYNQEQADLSDIP